MQHSLGKHCFYSSFYFLEKFNENFDLGTVSAKMVLRKNISFYTSEGLVDELI